MKKLTESNWKELAERFGGFHDAYLSELHLTADSHSNPGVVELTLVTSEWVKFFDKERPRYQVHFRLVDMREYSYSVREGEIHAYTVLDEMNVFWHAGKVWMDLNYHGPDAGNQVALVRQSPYYFACKELFVEVRDHPGKTVNDCGEHDCSTSNESRMLSNSVGNKMASCEVQADKERDDFNAKAKGHLEEYRDKLAFDHIENWECIADAVNIGWFDDIGDWWDYLSVRTALHIVSGIPSLQDHTLMKEFKDRLAAADERFKKVIRQDLPLSVEAKAHMHWWQQTVPVRGTKKLIASIKEAYGLEIEEIKDAERD